MTNKQRKDSVKKIVNLFRRSIRKLGRDFAAAVDPTDAVGLFAIMHQMEEMLTSLEKSSATWADRTLTHAYSRARSEVRSAMRRAGFKKTSEAVRSFRTINLQTIEALISDPSVGFVSSIKKATSQIKSRMRTIRNQAKILSAQQRVFEETIARVGILEGRNINKVKNSIVREIVSLKKSSELVWVPKVRSMGKENILSHIANLPFVKIPDERAKNGYRALRVDHYAETLARTKIMQAETLATRNETLAFDHPLVQFSRNKPLHDDACHMYIGRVFALTRDGAEAWGVRHVKELPNGGAPVHPNCTHTEIPYFPQYHSKEENAIAFASPPEWALNRPYSIVEKEFRRRGGKSAVKKISPTSARLGRETGGRGRVKRENQ